MGPADLATAFVAALVARDFSRAYAMTAPSYQAETSREQMQLAFEEMVQPIEPLGQMHLMDTMDHWPAKRPGDIAWVYVAIDGARWGEAVAVVLAEENGCLSVRQVEWGRP